MGEWQRAVEMYENLNRRIRIVIDVGYKLARSLQDGTVVKQTALCHCIRTSIGPGCHFDLGPNNAGTIYEQ